MVEPAPAMALRLEAARALGCTLTCLDPETGYLWRIAHDGVVHVLYGGLSPLNDAGAAAIATDKFHTATLLREAGFRVPESVRCLRPGRFSERAYRAHTGIDPARALAEEAGFPLIVKPAHGARGRSVVAVEGHEAMETALERVWRDDHLALVERVVPGTDVRVDMLDGEVLIAYERRPITVTGDGARALRELITDAGADPLAAAADPAWPEIAADLRAATATAVLDVVPPAGSVMAFRGPVLNLNRLANATVIDLPSAWITRGRKVADTLSLRHCGIDWKADGLGSDPAEAVVIEVNASPSMEQIARRGSHARALAGEMRVVEAILAARSATAHRIAR